MLSSTQWQWLEEELTKEAAITVIVSGVQVIFVLLIVGRQLIEQSLLEKHSHDKNIHAYFVCPTIMYFAGPPTNRLDQD